METDAERIARQNAEREEALRRVPLQTIEKSKWPKDVRPIAMSEADGLGIDPDGRLHWNGKPGYLHCRGRNSSARLGRVS